MVVLNIFMFIGPPIIAWTIHKYLRLGDMSIKRKIILFFVYLILINICTFGASYIRGVKGIHFSGMTLSYRLKYLGFGCVSGFIVPLAVCLITENQFTIGRRTVKSSKEDNLVGIVLFIFAIIFVYFVSSSTSSFCPYYYDGDSAQFQTIGKAWTYGKITYRDMFDHKGPYIFFINMLGYLLTGNSTGVMILQIINMYVLVIGIYKISQLYNKNQAYGILIVVIFLFVLSCTYCDGNMTEEYCLPFITFSMYFQLRWLKNKKEVSDIEHNIKYAFFYGISFAICILTRLTNGVTICAGVFIIGIYLLYNKKVDLFIKNALAFIVGIAIIVLPFSIYFAVVGALKDFWYGTIGYNIEYQKNIGVWLLHNSKKEWEYFFKFYVPFYTSFFTIFLLWKNRNYLWMEYVIGCVVLETYWYFSGALYCQYAMITVPQFTLFLNEVFSMEKDDKWMDSIKTILLCLVAMILVNSSKECILKVVDRHANYKEYKNVGYEELLDQIPDDERGSFVVYGFNEVKELYLLHDLLPNEKYFIIQEWHSKYSDYVKQDIRKTFQESETKWILTSGSVNNIADILEQRYEVVEKIDSFGLYHLKY